MLGGGGAGVMGMGGGVSVKLGMYLQRKETPERGLQRFDVSLL